MAMICPPRMFRTQPQMIAVCQSCEVPTPWRCLECGIPVCARCQVSMYAMCQQCRSRYCGEINILGKRADAFIRAEFDRMFV